MPQLNLFLIPSPGSKPEFLATLESSLPVAEGHSLILEGYTRDDWAVQPDKQLFHSILLKTLQDKKQKVSGFLTYLQQRNKVAYGRFGTDSMLVIGSNQPKVSTTSSSSTSMLCRYTTSLSRVPNCPFSKKKTPAATTKPKQTTKPAATAKPKQTASGGGGGLLGNLLGAQRRTNQHVMDSVQQPPTAPQIQHQASAASTSTITTPILPKKTSQQVLSDFRQEIQQQLLDFDISPDTSLKIPISLAKQSVGLLQKEQSKVTLDILKYIVYEQADEVNEEWIAAKEPSEFFVDQVVMCIYKAEQYAPPHVLEDLYKGDLPEEVRGAQRAVQDAMRKQHEAKEQKVHAQHVMQAHKQAKNEEDSDNNNDMATLNTVKRDRRTIEEIQREMRMNPNETTTTTTTKRQKTE